MKNKHLLDNTIALRHAGLVASFIWQDEAAEGGHAHVGASPDEAYIVGTLLKPKHDAPQYIVHVDGTADSGFGYSFPVDMDLKIALMSKDEELVPVSTEATEEEVAEAVQHTRQEVCEEYTNLMNLIKVGAYDEREPDGTWGKDGVEKRLLQLDRLAIEQGEHFMEKEDGSYALEPATQEEIEAYERTLEEEEEE